MKEKRKKKEREPGEVSLWTFIKEFSVFYKPHKKLFFLDMFCALLVAVCNLFYPRIAQNIINDYVPNGLLNLLITWSVVLLLIYAVKAVLNFIIQYWGHIVGVRIQADMRKKMFVQLQKLPFSYFDDNKTGTIMSRLINDLFEISELAHHGPEDVFLSLITIIGAIVMMAFIYWPLALMVLVFLPFMVLTVAGIRGEMRESWKKMRAETGEINAEVESSVAGVRVARAYTAEKHLAKKFDVANANFQKARIASYKVMGKFFSSMYLFNDLLYLLVLVGGGLFFYFGKIDGGEFTAFVLYIAMLITPIRTLVNIFEQIESGLSGYRRYREVMEVSPEEETGKIESDRITGDIRYEHVDFNYAGKTDRQVVKDVSLEIPEGKTVAFVGPSGGGKTTLCHLLPRFYEISGGKITIGGVDIRDYTRNSLRSSIGIVQQDVFLFPGSVRENIAYGKIGATEEEIVEAAKRANIHDYIMDLPDGYDTEVGERGVRLSGGQKQRISIARAFLKNPPILILDEATSALDNITETQIQEALERLSEGRTTIIVAHRLSTVKRADCIYVITKQGLIERGSHAELLAQNGFYTKLYEATLMTQ